MEKISVETFEELMFSGGKHIPAYMIFASYDEDWKALEKDIEENLKEGCESDISGCFERDLCIESDPLKRVKMADYYFNAGGAYEVLKYDTAVSCLKKYGYIEDGTLLLARIEDCKTVAEFRAKVDAENTKK